MMIGKKVYSNKELLLCEGKTDSYKPRKLKLTFNENENIFRVYDGKEAVFHSKKEKEAYSYFCKRLHDYVRWGL